MKSFNLNAFKSLWHVRAFNGTFVHSHFESTGRRNTVAFFLSPSKT